MATNERLRWRHGAGVGLGLLLISAAIPEAAHKPPSQYAPAADLKAQVDSYVRQIGEDLAKESDYGEEQQERVARNANTLMVLAQVLGMHDSDHGLKGAAPALLAASRELLGKKSDFGAAHQAFEKIQQSLKATAPAGSLQWEAVADMGLLMKQVPVVNNSLRRNVNPRRFAQGREQAAGLSATLAAIAQASMLDDVYCSGDEEIANWVRLCVTMRDAAAMANKSAHQGDQAAAQKAIDALAKTCDDCHAEFRK